MSEASDAWYDPYGCRDVSLAEDYIDELRQRVGELEKALDSSVNDFETLAEHTGRALDELTSAVKTIEGTGRCSTK